jgi:hypothetical protein
MADYIRREDALFALRKAERGGSMTALTRLERAYAEIREMPAADVAVVSRVCASLDSGVFLEQFIRPLDSKRAGIFQFFHLRF